MQGVPSLWFAARSLVLFAALGCAGDDEAGVTYAEHIRPMLHDCALCHRPGAPFGPELEIGPDVVNAYAPPYGLVVAPNNWKLADPSLPIPAQLVVPGQPEDSFLVTKIDPALRPFPEHAGDPMPLQIPAITPEELDIVEQWVRSGAQPAEYDARVAPLFRAAAPYLPGKCDVCHFKGSPNPPDITDPFGPEGIVGVRSTFRSDLMRVAPGDPDASLLVLRLRASALGEPPSSEIGAPMPKPVLPLSEAQVALVRQWIAEGAQP
jgi:hypothetical protein